MTLPSGFVVTYAYDALGRVSGASIGSGPGGPFSSVVYNVTYFPFGDVQQIDSSNGVGRYQSDDLQYRPNGLFLTKGATTLIERFFVFGDNLNLTELNNDAVASAQTQDFNYDDAQRLTYASGAYGSRLWTYDQVGNRLAEQKTASGTTTTQSYTYPPTSNRLTGVTQGSTSVPAFAYDGAGNIIQDSRSGTPYSYAINDAYGASSMYEINGLQICRDCAVKYLGLENETEAEKLRVLTPSL